MTTEWIISGNPKKYDVIGAFHELGKVDWTQSANIQAGDIVYIYVSEDIQAIRFKCLANKVDLPNVEIEDQKFNISGEFDGSHGRYMELEMIDELKGDLYTRKQLMNHGFSSPLGPVKLTPSCKEYLDLVQRLQHTEEMDPDQHDGCYEIVREIINSYAKMPDLSEIDYADLNLIYLMTVGTWTQKIETKKKNIRDCHLPEDEKNRITLLLDQIWARAESMNYQNKYNDGPSIGMFGTGFFSFNGKADENSARNFVQLCIDIQKLTNEHEILERCKHTLNNQLKGMQAAAASMVLHCLKPNVFPIFNANMGSDNIFEYLGVEIKKKTKLETYIDNVERVNAFRDQNFTIKNYRIFDCAAWEIKKTGVNLDIDEEVVYWPSKDEYDPGITKEKWAEILRNDRITLPETLKMLKMMLDLGGESTCKHLEDVFGGSYAAYNRRGSSFGKNVRNETNCPLCSEGDKDWLFTVPFLGRRVIEDGSKRYSWKLRDELKAALQEMDLSDINIYEEETEVKPPMKEYDKNIILYGPPGTGKTYHAVIYAVAIIEGKELKEVEAEPYETVMERFNAYKAQGLIKSTTFHQSYGYEEFIEGISPVIDDNEEGANLQYILKDGIFKKFCSEASKPTIIINDEIDIPINKEPQIWKVSLGGTKENSIRRDCLDNGHIRIGWDEYGQDIEQISEYSNGGKGVLNAFYNRMQVGDIVLSCYTNRIIDAIGVVTGDGDWDDSFEHFKRIRNVLWLAKDIRENIVDINAGKTMTLSSVYKLSIPLQDVMVLIKKSVQSKNIVEPNTNRYVFIIDEINRGNISKIFGELITLIENTKREGMPEAASAVLPYSGKSFSIPSNVYILGTMNTADRSIALMDTALRRRFSFVEMMPNADILEGIEVDGLNIADMLRTINERIEYLYDREHTIGHAFFTRLLQPENQTISTLSDIFRKAIIPLLQEYFYEDYMKIQLVLGDNAKTDENLKFIKDSKTNLKNIFIGNVDESVDLPEVRYSINNTAFDNIESYLQIMKKESVQ